MKTLWGSQRVSVDYEVYLNGEKVPARYADAERGIVYVPRPHPYSDYRCYLVEMQGKVEIRKVLP